jgi:hypothetical protein
MCIGAASRALGMVAVMALAACGGGGSSEEKPAFGVTVTIDGAADAAGPLAAGETETIEVPSGATLVFESAGETRWEPTATGSSYEVNSFSFTSKSMTVSSNAGGSLMVVFSDKADASQKATLNVTVAAKEFDRVARVDGETETWSTTTTDSAGAPRVTTRLDRTVLMDAGGYGIESEDAETGASFGVRTLYDSQDRVLGYRYIASGEDCLNDKPVVMVEYPLQVGKSWSSDTKQLCSSFQSVEDHSSGTVEAFERIVVPQGSHDTLRLRYEGRSTSTSIYPTVPPFVFSWTATCWWAVDVGRMVKCETATQGSDGSSSQITSVLTDLTS